MKCVYKQLLCVAAVVTTISTRSAADEPWVHHRSFADFSAGQLGDGGANVYITSRGQIEMIRRWDFNNDGFLDVVVSQDHNQLENADVMVYWGNANGPNSILPEVPKHQPFATLLKEIQRRDRHVTRLPSDGGGRSLLVDLNGDGYPEVVFCNYIHNYSVHMNALIYWGGANGFDAQRRTELPTLMASAVAAADFNQDGFVDLAFANNGIEGGEQFGHYHHLESYIYWNGPTGFSADRRSTLPTVSAIDCAADDLNDDGFPELVFLNNNSDTRSIYVYRGSAEGFSETRRAEIPVEDAWGMHLAELDGDDRLDLVLLTNEKVQLFRGQGGAFDGKPWRELPANHPRGCRSGDLNRDGFLDLIIANYGTAESSSSVIYWGHSRDYSEDRRIELPTLHATDVVIADFNNDGWSDLAFSNEHDGLTYDVSSYIYWNGPDGFDCNHRRDLLGFGPASAAAADLDKDGHQDLLLVNRYSGAQSSIPSFIYWGNSAHQYSHRSMSELPGKGGPLGLGDFNQDGFVDICFGCGLIYWGAADGYQVQRRQDLGAVDGHGAAVADLNRDGFLDLVFPRGRRKTDSSGAVVGASTARIVWGSSDGYHLDNHHELELHTRISQSANIADLNKDGYLDLVFPDVDSDIVDIFWGTPTGTFSSKQHTQLKVQPSSTVEFADFNRDGWLDMIFGGGWDSANHGLPTRQALLLWGGKSGFDRQRSVKLEAYDSLEQAVADLNKDGYLDIVVTSYHAYHTRSIPVFIYWGSPDGNYGPHRRTALPAESSGAVFVADLNQDSWLDLVVCNHLYRGDHSVGSHIFWNGPDGFSATRRQWFPTFGPHFGIGRDLGNIDDRRLEEHYISAALECPRDKQPGELRWQSLTPRGTSVKFQVRTADSAKTLSSATWKGPEGTGGDLDFYEHSPAALQVPSEHRWLQYRATLTTPDGGSTPALTEVQIST